MRKKALVRVGEMKGQTISIDIQKTHFKAGTTKWRPRQFHLMVERKLQVFWQPMRLLLT